MLRSACQLANCCESISPGGLVGRTTLMFPRADRGGHDSTSRQPETTTNPPPHVSLHAAGLNSSIDVGCSMIQVRVGQLFGISLKETSPRFRPLHAVTTHILRLVRGLRVRVAGVVLELVGCTKLSVRVESENQSSRGGRTAHHGVLGRVDAVENNGGCRTVSVRIRWLYGASSWSPRTEGSRHTGSQEGSHGTHCGHR
jgi:hypothetical protein